MKIKAKKINQNNKFKSVKIELNNSKKLFINFIPKKRKKFIIIFLLLSFLLIIPIIVIYSLNTSNNIINFDYSNYDKNIITEEMVQIASWNLTKEEAFTINGIIRKHKPKKCLELGVGKGGTSILILNAIKDIKNSLLVSIDLHHHVQDDPSKFIGYKVDKYFPEVSKDKWKLLLGDMPFRFLQKLNLKFNLVIIDTSHIMPGEILNIIEVMPFLEDDAIIIFPNLISHMKKAYNIYNFNYTEIDKYIIKRTPTSILLMSTLVGKKKIIYNKNRIMGNLGYIFLEKNQEKYYENYFLLLMCIWENMLTDEQIFQMRLFIEKYYKKEKYINIFENAILYNKEYQKNFK